MENRSEGLLLPGASPIPSDEETYQSSSDSEKPKSQLTTISQLQNDKPENKQSHNANDKLDTNLNNNRRSQSMVVPNHSLSAHSRSQSMVFSAHSKTPTAVRGRTPKIVLNQRYPLNNLRYSNTSQKPLPSRKQSNGEFLRSRIATAPVSSGPVPPNPLKITTIASPHPPLTMTTTPTTTTHITLPKINVSTPTQEFRTLKYATTPSVSNLSQLSQLRKDSWSSAASGDYSNDPEMQFSIDTFPMQRRLNSPQININSPTYDMDKKFELVKPVTTELLFWNVHKVFIPEMREIQTFGPFYKRMRHKWYKDIQRLRESAIRKRGGSISGAGDYRNHKAAAKRSTVDDLRRPRITDASPRRGVEDVEDEAFEIAELLHPECRYQSNDEQWMVLLGGTSTNWLNLKNHYLTPRNGKNEHTFSNDHYHSHTTSHNDLGDGYESEDDTGKEEFMLWALPIQISQDFIKTLDISKKEKGLLATAKSLIKGSNSNTKKYLGPIEIQNLIKSKPYEKNPIQMAIQDDSRAVEEIIMSPDGRYAALIDSLGRISIFDCTNLVLTRIFKGYRHAQVAWIFVNPDVVELTPSDIQSQCFHLQPETPQRIEKENVTIVTTTKTHINNIDQKCIEEDPPLLIDHTINNKKEDNDVFIPPMIPTRSDLSSSSKNSRILKRESSTDQYTSGTSQYAFGSRLDSPHINKIGTLRHAASCPVEIPALNSPTIQPNYYQQRASTPTKSAWDEWDRGEDRKIDNDPCFCDESNNRDRQLLNDMPTQTYRRNVLLLVIYVSTRGLLEIYSVGCKKRLYAVSIFPKCKLIYTFNWSIHPPWPYIIFQRPNGKLFRLSVSPQILEMLSKSNDNHSVEKNSNINESLKHFSVRRREEWKYYCKKYFNVIRKTFIFYLHDIDAAVEKGFHTAIGRHNFQVKRAHLKRINIVKWFVCINECTGGLTIGIVRHTQDLLLKVTKMEHFDFTETEQGWGYQCDGTIKHNGQVLEYGNKYSSGDIITVILNLTDGSLAFAVNDQNAEIAYGKDKHGPIPMDDEHSYRLAMKAGFDFSTKVTLSGITFA